MDYLDELIPVTGEDEDSVAVDATADPLETSGGTDNTDGMTSATPDSDVAGSGNKEPDYKSKFLELQQARERDVAAVKSAHQKQLADARREFNEKLAEMQSKMEAIQLSSMDEEDKANYLKQKELKERDLVSKQKQEYESKLAELNQIRTYQDFAIQKIGLKLEDLDLSGGTNELVNSIWEKTLDKLDKLQKEVARLGKSSNAKPNAPDVNTNMNQRPATPGAKMADLIKVYGSEEGVYRALEEGRLSPDDFPVT